MRNAIRLIDFKTVSAKENLASANGRDQRRSEVVRIARTVCIKNLDRTTRATNGLDASAYKPTRHHPPNPSRTGQPAPPQLRQRKHLWQREQSGLQSDRAGP